MFDRISACFPASELFDLLIVGVGLVLLLPVYAVIALLVWVDLGLPVIFRQQRPGYKGRPFMLYKFRSMQTGKAGMRRAAMLRLSGASCAPPAWTNCRNCSTS